MSKKKKSWPIQANEQSRSGGASAFGPAGTSCVNAGVVFVAKEGSEPVADDTTVPVLIFALIALLLYWANLYVADNSGGFHSQVYYPFGNYKQVVDANPKDPIQEAMDRGERVFGQVCAACHQATGMGLTGQFPPLAGSEWVNVAGPNRIIRIVLNGLIGPIDVNGVQFNNNMLAWKDTLTDEQIADALTYVGSKWGNKGPTVTPEHVKKIRGQVTDRDSYWTADELKKIPEKD